MKILYISPSVIPSRSANSIHIINICAAFAQTGAEVTLVGSSGEISTETEALQEFYGVNLSGVEHRLIKPRFSRGITLQIAISALCIWMLGKVKRMSFDVLFCRNIYAALFFKFLAPSRTIYEVHQVEYGIIGAVQGLILRDTKVLKITISEALAVILKKEHKLSNSDFLVLHDAAPSGIKRFSKKQIDEKRKSILSEESVGKTLVGYFGHLYPGRGVEIVMQSAEKLVNIEFYIFGGNDELIEKFRSTNRLANLHFMGHVPPKRVSELMRIMDILFMPYQRKVSIGSRRKNDDTSAYMSPLKMFEYMAAGGNIVSSDLPVLREVLRDQENCLLANPECADDWVSCVEKLTEDRNGLGKKISDCAFTEYNEKYNWVTRAESIKKEFLEKNG